MVVVAGGGSTGLGVAWDLALRGIPVTLVEMRDLTEGTSGRFHGLLHSGGRYVVTDPEAARECYEENVLLRRIVPQAVTGTGGYFVRLEDDDPAFEERWVQAAQSLGVPVRPVPRGEVLRAEPVLSRSVASAYSVPDGGIDSFRLELALRRGIEERGGVVRTATRVTGAVEENGRLVGVRVRGPGGDETIAADAFVGATGPWAAEVAALFGLALDMHLARGTMLIFANRQVRHVVNHLLPPGDGDILVPHDRVAIFGTTDVRQETPEAPAPPAEEVQELMRLGRRLFPEIDRWRVLRAFTGVRPLYDPHSQSRETGHATRSFTVLDHGALGGVAGAFSIVGGKLTTFRSMAEQVTDAVVRYLGEERPCRTREVPLPGAHAAGPSEAARSGGPGPHDLAAQIVCECEGVTAGRLSALRGEPLARRRVGTWFAMGPCQGTFCGHRAAAIRMREAGPDVAISELAALRTERVRGFLPVAWGDNMRELLLQRQILSLNLGESLPEDVG